MKAVAANLLMLLALAICFVDVKSLCRNQKPKNCLAPCRSSSTITCPNYPDAKCKNNYCGGVCKAKFIMGPTDVTPYCDACPPAEPGSDPPTCSANGISFCNGLICKGYPNAVCYDDYCDCTAKFYNDNQYVGDCDTCPDTLLKVDVCPDICDDTSCECYPEAECSGIDIDYCDGQCIPMYTVDSKAVDCNRKKPCQPCIEENGQPVVCKLNMAATCKTVNCGECSRYWELPSGAKLTEDDCFTCPAHSGPSTTLIGVCDVDDDDPLQCYCLGHTTATCIMDGYQCTDDGNCHVRFEDDAGMPVTCDTCSSGGRGDGSNLIYCAGNPQCGEVCPGHSYTCIWDNYQCSDDGNCHIRFEDEGNPVICG